MSQKWLIRDSGMIKHLATFCCMCQIMQNMNMFNYGTVNNTNSLHYSTAEVLIDVINSIVAIHVFDKQLHFLLEFRVTYGRMNFQSEICLAVASWIHFQPLVALWFLSPCQLVFKLFFFSTWAWVLIVFLVFVN